MDKACRVWITKFAEKQLRKLPQHIAAAYHDEPLKGDRKGQRSVRLNKGYRVIYEETESGNLVLIAVQEVNKHEY